MGLMDSILSELGNGNSGGADLGSLAKTLLASQGGDNSMLDTVVNTMKEKGMGDEVSSWIGNGENASVTSSQLNKVLDSDMMDSISEKTGIPKEQISSTLATLLPVLVNKLTPEGKAGDGGSLVSTGMNILKGFL